MLGTPGWTFGLGFTVGRGCLQRPDPMVQHPALRGTGVPKPPRATSPVPNPAPATASPSNTSGCATPPAKKHPHHPPKNPPSHPPQHPLHIHPAASPASGRHACACLCMRVHGRTDGRGGVGGVGGCEGCPPTRWVLLIGQGAVQNSPVAMGPTSPRCRTVYKGRRRSGQGQ